MGPVLLSLLLILLSIIVYLLKRSYTVNQHWKKRGVPHVKPLLFIGNSAQVLFRKKQISELHEDICNLYPNEPVVGFYDFFKPMLMIKDVNLIEKILIKDFMYFTDRGLSIDEKKNPLDASLFTMTGKRWRALRIKLSPIFTSGKLKSMFEPLDDCGNGLITVVDTDKKNDVDLKEILGRFSMDAVGSCAFGIDAKSLTEPDNEFHRMGKKRFEMTFVQFVKFILVRNFPKLFNALGISFNKPEVINYFCGLIKSTLNHRKNNNIQRNDFIQLMMQLQQKGFVELQTRDPGDDYLQIDTSAYKTESFEISDDLILGQAFTFLTAGFETTAVTLMYTLYELAKHPEIMKKVKEEIKEKSKDDESLTYDSLREMTYLEQCVKETLRKYPPVPFLFRICTKEYSLPNGLTIPKGESLLIPIKAVHYDPEHYPEPNQFVPERFDPDRTIHPCAYLPFGNGPRICIAMRFAMMQLKYGVAKLLKTYSFELSPKTEEPLLLDTINFITKPRNKILLNVVKD